MALLDRLAGRAISSLPHLLRRPLLSVVGGALLWLALAQIIKHTIDPHLILGFATALNLTGLVIIGSALLYDRRYGH